MNEQKEKREQEKQIVEGVVGEFPTEWRKKLPAGVTPEMVDIYLGNDNLWHWHLKEAYIEDEEEREKYKKEKEMWP